MLKKSFFRFQFIEITVYIYNSKDAQKKFYFKEKSFNPLLNKFFEELL